MTDEGMIAALRRIHDAFNRGDFESVVQLVRPDIELVRPGGQSSVKGVGALREWMEPDAFEEQRVEPLDFRVKGDKVLVREHVMGRGAGSGIEVDVVGFIVWTMDDQVRPWRWSTPRGPSGSAAREPQFGSGLGLHRSSFPRLS